MHALVVTSGYVDITKRHETHWDHDFWGLKVSKFSANTERKEHSLRRTHETIGAGTPEFFPHFLKFNFSYSH